jgi:hypothetical protein
MLAIKAVSSTILLAAAMWCQAGAAGADDSNAAASAQRIQATIAAQSMLGYAPVAEPHGSACCCSNGAVTGYATGNLQQQIAALSAAMKQSPKPATLSPAMLAEGAY